MASSLSDPKGTMIGFDSPERASVYFLEVLLRLQPYAQTVMMDRHYAPDCSYTHPLFQVPPIDSPGLPLPLAERLNSREALKLLFRAKRTLLPQTIWKTDGSAFDSKSNKVFILMQHKLDLWFMPKTFSALNFKVATTLQLKPIYLTLDDGAYGMPNRGPQRDPNVVQKASYSAQDDHSATTRQYFDSAKLKVVSKNGNRLQNDLSMRNHHLSPVISGLPVDMDRATPHSEEIYMKPSRVSQEDHGINTTPLTMVDSSTPKPASRSGVTGSCSCAPKAVYSGSCTSCKCDVGSDPILTTRWVICSQEDMMQPKDILRYIFLLPAVVVLRWLESALSLVHVFESLLLDHGESKAEAHRPDKSAFGQAHLDNPVSERPAGAMTMKTAFLPGDCKSKTTRVVDKARANVMESLANARTHVESLSHQNAIIYDPRSYLEDPTYEGETDANYNMRYMQGNLISRFNNYHQHTSGKSKSVRFRDDSFGKGAGEASGTKCNIEHEY